MGKKVRSARGDQVDFDLLKIKEEISSQPPPQDVQLRQDFIERRLRRKLRKVAPPAPKIEAKEKPVDKKMPGTEELSEEPKKIDEVEEPVEEKKKPTRQRTRPNTNKTEQ